MLAAGRSTRFGTSDKLTAMLGDLPLGLHAARALASLQLASLFVVTNCDDISWAPFVKISNDRPDAGMAYSITLGLDAARSVGAKAILVALADMPLVPASHFEALLNRYEGPDSFIATGDGSRRMPPALFGEAWFSELNGLSGDRGARDLLCRAALVEIAPEYLLDVDHPHELVAGRDILVRR